MTNSQEERKYFWNKLKEILKEANSPFKIKIQKQYGEDRHFATIKFDKREFFINFMTKDGEVNIGTYINAEIKTKLLEMQADIEKVLGQRIIFKNGPRKEDIQTVVMKYDVIVNDRDNYEQLLRNNIKSMTAFIKLIDLAIFLAN